MGSNDNQLESYLSALDKALGQIPASARAEIILEIKSHALDAKAKEPSRSTAALLASLGEPEVVANRYLLERGLKPAKAPKGAVVKWLTIGFLGTVAMAIFAVGLVAYHFSPVVSVDEEKGTVAILGGMISVKGDPDEENGQALASAGKRSWTFDRAQTDLLRIETGNGKVTIAPSLDEQLHWDCRGVRGMAEDPTKVEKTIVLNLTALHFHRCDVEVPGGLPVRVDGSNGKLVVSRPGSNFDVTLANGKVVIQPDPAKAYRYDLRATNGRVENFASSDAPNALQIKVQIANGRIVRE